MQADGQALFHGCTGLENERSVTMSYLPQISFLVFTQFGTQPILCCLSSPLLVLPCPVLEQHTAFFKILMSAILGDLELGGRVTTQCESTSTLYILTDARQMTRTCDPVRHADYG